MPCIMPDCGGARQGVGGWLPEGSQQMCAAAGSVILYDSKTWHRAASERNVSGSDRIAILNAVTPRFVVPMIDMVRGALTGPMCGAVADRTSITVFLRRVGLGLAGEGA